MSAKVLIFDADDTLWENNVLFERVVDDFFAWIDHPTLDSAQTRKVLDDVQAANIVTHGYGAKMFLRSLHDCFERLNTRPADAAEKARIDELAGRVVRNEVELIPGVAATLDALGRSYRLIMLTKGDAEEQQRKIDASGLAGRFESIHIVAEKNVATYEKLIASENIDPARAWMLGNSLKSDIGPALAAGLNAVYLPNENTWVLDGEDDVDLTNVLTVDAFPDLLKHFTGIAALLDGYEPIGPLETADVAKIVEMVRGAQDPWSRELPLHLTSSAVVVHPPTRRVLLRWHQKLGSWLQIGGHGDPGETDPIDVVLREGEEETNLRDLRPWPNADLVHATVVSVPESPEEPAHHHADLRFVLATDTPDDARPEKPTAPLRWLTLDEAFELLAEDNLRETLERVAKLFTASS